MLRCFITILACMATLWPVNSAAGDWRTDLLESLDIATTTESLKQVVAKTGMDQARVETIYQQLGSDDYQQREKAQRMMISEGGAVLDYLKSKQPIGNPEIRKRVSEILRQLETNIAQRKNRMVIHAAQSLLESRKDKTTGGMFYEWFGEECVDFTDGYRGWTHQGHPQAKARVTGGQLTIPGNHNGEIDQRLVFRSSTWPGTDAFPDHFTVSCLIGSHRSGAGTYHPGITIGNVKALMHPGYRGGGFRFEQVGTQKKFTQNISMGYTPAAGAMHRMKITVKPIGNEKISLKTTIISPNKQRFETSTMVTREDIGPIRQISLDRSGRRGGEAMFGDFQIEIHP